MRVVLTGGGTGGHIYPALAIARGLKESQPKVKILFVGTQQGMEATIVPKEGYRFRTVTAEGLERRVSWRIIKTGVKLIKGFIEAYRVLRDFQPTVVVGTGGYVCGPVVMVASLMGLPTVIHEQNALPGITNRFLAGRVDRVLTTFPDSVRHFPKSARVFVTGLPIRSEILRVTREVGARCLKIDPAKFTLLVVGGSRGAQSINRAMGQVLLAWQNRHDRQIVFVTGQAGYDDTMANLQEMGIDLAKCGNIMVTPYVYDMENALAVADLVVCRAGAATLAEITAKGIPAVLIPYPFAAENHQEFNARSLVERGAAELILDRELSGERLLGVLDRLFSDRKRLARMAAASKSCGQPDALDEIINHIKEVSRKS
ncbi:MAG: undecaprenyldiphospho-muramoylpentapeptide beta-N-acetylglucosaminyltransferase [Firmicutes bacterium]|nr:undecaprenyldiphospho-muramoylpentapeptide beta-N-acetylglucosaminyltransferase [Bacillota bacterium]